MRGACTVVQGGDTALQGKVIAVRRGCAALRVERVEMHEQCGRLHGRYVKLPGAHHVRLTMGATRAIANGYFITPGKATAGFCSR